MASLFCYDGYNKDKHIGENRAELIFMMNMGLGR